MFSAQRQILVKKKRNNDNKTMVSDKVNFEWAFDEHHYKSCFARSVAVNSQFKQTKSMEEDPQQQQLLHQQPEPIRPLLPVEEGPVKLRKNSRAGNMEDHRRSSSCTSSSVSSSRRTSFCSSRIAEIPIENIVHQSKVDSLQWQLKETEKSREMYKAVMKQVVTFLEKTHRSLELLSNRINSKKSVPRSKSEHQIMSEETCNTLNSTDDYTTFRDFTWRRPKKEETPPEEIPPEKLSQEAFRLLRTAQSLLSTQEPKLMSPVEDAEFLAQLAKEFPSSPTPTDIKPQRTTSFSLSPKLLMPERDSRISTAFNRKLSLQIGETRRSLYAKLATREPPSDLLEQRRKSFSDKTGSSDKSGSPPAGSVSSVEDESGFSSMNSFQDVGLPLVADEVTAKNVLLKSMLQNNDAMFATSSPKSEDVKLWQKPEGVVQHQRWSSTPANYTATNTKQMNVLWV